MSRLFFNHRFFSLLLLSFLLLGGAAAKASVNYPFKPSSLLSSGHWVKVGVEETGIYEISYDELRQMGFEDPSKVGVFGKGGTAMPISFTNGSDPLITDDLEAVGTWHHDNKIFFYGRGVEEIQFNRYSSQFEKKSRNIYILEGSYFLSDSPEAVFISPEEMPTGKITNFHLGFDYLYHELDLFQNTTHTGQLFWGEDLIGTEGYRKKFHLPLIDTNTKAQLDCRVYAADKSSGSLRYGVTEATGGNRVFNVKHPSPTSGENPNPDFAHMATPVLSLSLPSDEIEVYAEVSDAAGDFINLDYWILTYSKNIPDFSLSDNAQERFTILKKNAKAGVFYVPAEQNVAVFDISEPSRMCLLPEDKGTAKSSFYFHPTEAFHDFIFCNLDKKQLSITGFETVTNSDLHSLASRGADFLIITVPQFKGFAERLADLHRRYDGIEVAIAVTPEIYNEFSGGMPDPMAYRAITKMTYEASEGRMKNVLFVGKLFGDFRKILTRDDPQEYIIGFQDLKVSAETEASNAMDFFGFMDDYIYTSLQNNSMQVGVGLLPFLSDEEAERYLRKAERYMSDTDKASIVNEFLSIGGVGDNHTHDTQGMMLAEHWDSYSPDRHVNSVLAIDAYGEKEAKKKLFSDLRYGKLFSVYFGHGTASGLNSTYDFFRVQDINNIKNDRPGFMLICACDLSNMDHLKKGFGETIVTDTEYGMLGSIMASRTVWSGQNFELAKLISSALFASPEKYYDEENPNVLRTKYRESSPTMGEVFARSKTLSNYSNSLTYNYIGDPALIIPVPLRRISAHLPAKGASGEIISMKGTVLQTDTIHLRDTLPIGSYSLPLDSKFNGRIVAKVLSPEKIVMSKDYITNTQADGKTIYVPSPDYRLGEFKGIVKDGEYEMEITVPDAAIVTPGDTLRLMLSAYDPERKLAASGKIDLILAEGSTSGNKDTQDPALMMSYEEAGCLQINVSDNVGLSGDCIEVFIDENPTAYKLVDSDDCFRNLEFNVATDRLTDGPHTLRVRAKDQAANLTEETLDFIKKQDEPTLALMVDHKAVKDSIQFDLDSESDGNWILVITDANGAEIFRDAFNGTSLNWSCTNSSGVKVMPGLYNAMVRSADKVSDYKFSAKVSFAVIE